MARAGAVFWLYLAIVFAFVFAPIITSMIFSFNSDRFPTVPLGEFTTLWYETAFSRPEVWEAMQNSLIVALTAATPFFRGQVSDIDVRWTVIAQSVDDRTPEERGVRPMGD